VAADPVGLGTRLRPGAAALSVADYVLLAERRRRRTPATWLAPESARECSGLWPGETRRMAGVTAMPALVPA
jgi:hypothetical protein